MASTPTLPPVKRGDTFGFQVELQDSDANPVAITGTPTAQIRTDFGKLVDTLTWTPGDDSNTGTFGAADTLTWPSDVTLFCDVTFSDEDGGTISTQQFIVPVTEGVTHA